MIWPETFVEHLTGAPGPANDELFHHLVSKLPPRRRDAVVLHFYECLPYKAVGEQMGVSATRAMQQADMGVRSIRERIAMDTGIVPLPIDKPEHGDVLREIIASSPAEYQALITTKQQRKAEAAARALEKHRVDSINSLDLTLPTHRTLLSSGITTVGQLAAMTEAELRSLGYVNIENIQSRLCNIGLRLKH